MNSEAAQKAIQFFKDHHTVVDPTAGWGEMAGHSKEVDVATFEPGIAKAPFVLDAKFRGMGGNTTAEQMRTRDGADSRRDRRAAQGGRDHRSGQRHGAGRIRAAPRIGALCPGRHDAAGSDSIARPSCRRAR